MELIKQKSKVKATQKGVNLKSGFLYQNCSLN